LTKAIAANVPIAIAEATAKEGDFAWRRWIGREERRRLTVWAEVMDGTREGACTKSG